jgi:hypothetical protein
MLDGQEVSTIGAHFEDSADGGDAAKILANTGKLFQGSIFLGEGFLLTHEQAEELIGAEPANADVIFPVINGQETNNEPDQKPGRAIINFHDWSQEKASEYEAPFEIVERLVKAERQKSKRTVRRERWWQYAERATGLYTAIRLLSRCFVAAATTKYLNFSAASTNYVYTHALYVFTTDRWDLYAVVQSTLHEIWARKYSGALETRLRYSPSDCFETFAFPETLWQTANPVLAEIGEGYHKQRKTLMQLLWLGLTDIYNLFHARDLTPALVAKISKKPGEAKLGYQGLLELRNLHRELDCTIRDAYGWHDLDLGHDLHDVETLPENDRIRFTISPAARKEVPRPEPRTRCRRNRQRTPCEKVARLKAELTLDMLLK